MTCENVGSDLEDRPLGEASCGTPADAAEPRLSGRRMARCDLAEQAKRIVEENHTSKFSLKGIASALYVDESYLSRAFKVATGTTLLAYHNQVRCEEAKALLAQPDLSVSYVGSAVGYASTAHFCRVFKKVVGLTPGEYRRTAPRG